MLYLMWTICNHLKKKNNVINDSFYLVHAQTDLFSYALLICLFFINCSIDIVLVIDQCCPFVKSRAPL